MNNLLTIENLTKTFYSENGEVEAIKDFSLDIKDGEIIAIVGSSGCGKSTLLSILANLEEKSSGEIKFNVDNPKIGYMLQQDALFPWLNILENTLTSIPFFSSTYWMSLIGLKITKNKNKENVLYAKQLLVTYGLEDFLDKYPNELSGGMRQRVALIRTLAIKPDLLLLDEPFCALDYQTRLSVSDDVFNIIKKENKTTIIVTHDLAEAISFADRIIVLSKRPAVIKNIYAVKLTDKKNPIHNRKAPEFSYYYDMIWKDLDKNVWRTKKIFKKYKS